MVIFFVFIYVSLFVCVLFSLPLGAMGRYVIVVFSVNIHLF